VSKQLTTLETEINVGKDLGRKNHEKQMGAIDEQNGQFRGI
jgi:hypothetical protein